MQIKKSTVTICFENNLVLSAYIGDLNSLKSMEYFKRTINTFKRFYDFEPQVIVCDKHPNYESTKFALQLKQENPKNRVGSNPTSLCPCFISYG